MTEPPCYWTFRSAWSGKTLIWARDDASGYKNWYYITDVAAYGWASPCFDDDVSTVNIGGHPLTSHTKEGIDMLMLEVRARQALGEQP